MLFVLLAGGDPRTLYLPYLVQQGRCCVEGGPRLRLLHREPWADLQKDRRRAPPAPVLGSPLAWRPPGPKGRRV